MPHGTVAKTPIGTAGNQRIYRPIRPTYRDCQKNVPIAGRFFCYNTYAAIYYSEHYYDKRSTCHRHIIFISRQNSIFPDTG
jgi:hypothetical protein